MTKMIRIMLTCCAELATAFQSALGLARDKARNLWASSPKTSAEPNFFVRLRQDPDFRARFTADPAAALRELGLDPSLFNVPAAKPTDRSNQDRRAVRPPPLPPQALVAVYGSAPGRAPAGNHGSLLRR